MRLYLCVPGNYVGDKRIYTRIHLYDGTYRDFYFGDDITITRAALILPELIKRELGNRWRQRVITYVPEFIPKYGRRK